MSDDPQETPEDRKRAKRYQAFIAWGAILGGIGAFAAAAFTLIPPGDNDSPEEISSPPSTMPVVVDPPSSTPSASEPNAVPSADETDSPSDEAKTTGILWTGDYRFDKQMGPNLDQSPPRRGAVDTADLSVQTVFSDGMVWFYSEVAIVPRGKKLGQKDCRTLAETQSEGDLEIGPGRSVCLITDHGRTVLLDIKSTRGYAVNGAFTIWDDGDGLD
ncbi:MULTISPECIES: hypothetical protein [unclassified Streptomyces]|uniref:hypothetical protein n=1 Tax=unclassified Streptomyces TaxID=2593676 RepID=UPI003801229C